MRQLTLSSRTECCQPQLVLQFALVRVLCGKEM